jgi:hypothetical protein
MDRQIMNPWSRCKYPRSPRIHPIEIGRPKVDREAVHDADHRIRTIRLGFYNSRSSPNRQSIDVRPRSFHEGVPVDQSWASAEDLTAHIVLLCPDYQSGDACTADGGAPPEEGHYPHKHAIPTKNRCYTRRAPRQKQHQLSYRQSMCRVARPRRNAALAATTTPLRNPERPSHQSNPERPWAPSLRHG